MPLRELLNHRTVRLSRRLLSDPDLLRVTETASPSGARLVDCRRGGLQAGLALARLCLSDLASVRLVPGSTELPPGPAVAVATDQPLAACMASQYAGWKLAAGKFFAMGSGPMRAAAAKEPLFQKIGFQERPREALGVLETGAPPPEEICLKLAAECGVRPAALTLWFAPTSSQPGNVQIVARCVETALHKLFELGFDPGRIESGFGVAPLPPVARHDLAGIGRTNDAILYGGQATLWVRGDDDSLAEIGPRVPSCSSPDHGQPFAEIFQRYDGDFYRIDPQLFSPAVITFQNLDTGRVQRFGRFEPELIARSFAG